MNASMHPILLVEDSLADAEMAIDALRAVQPSHPVEHVEDGVDCLDFLHCRGPWNGRASGDPSVILLDIKMPRMGGLEVLRRLRAEARFERMPVVIMSSSREESDLIRSWNLGANAYVIKPVDADQFHDAVRTVGEFWGKLNQQPEQD